jgi:sulfate/thiosulfate-binding protein
VRCRVDAADINAISDKAKLLPEDWQEWLPINSAPYTSTVVFLVRAGNPKKIHNWPDLVHPGIGVITANPKTSGGARWNYLAAWTYASKADKGDSAKVLDYMKKLCANMPVLDSGSRGATTTFAERGIGDVLIAWENEVDLAIAESSGKGFEIVVPSIGIRAEPPVAVVDDVATRHGTLDVAKAYLQFLYTAQGQTIAAKHGYRPALPQLVDPALLKPLQKVPMVTIDGAFGGWAKAQAACSRHEAGRTIARLAAGIGHEPGLARPDRVAAAVGLVAQDHNARRRRRDEGAPRSARSIDHSILQDI